MHLIAMVRRLAESAESRAICPERLATVRCRLWRGHDLPHRAPSRNPGSVLLWTAEGAWSEHP